MIKLKRLTAITVVLLLIFQIFSINTALAPLYVSAADTKPPTEPGDITIVSASSTSISISWSASTDRKSGIAGYLIYQNGTYIDSTTNLSYIATGLTPDTSYTLGVSAIDTAGNESTQNSIIATTDPDTDPPSSPGNLICTDSTMTSATLEWSASTDNIGVTGYLVYQDGVSVGTTASLQFTVSNLEPANQYTFTVSAVDSAGNISTASNSVLIETSDVELPTTPLNLSAINTSDTQVSLQWEQSTDNVGVTGYNIYCDQNLVGTTTSTFYTIDGLINETSYSVTVSAIDAAQNESNASEPLNVITSLGIPTGVSGLPACTAITVSWGAVFGAILYDIQIGDTIFSDIDSVEYTIRGLNTSTSYTIKVRAKSESNTSNWSSTIDVTTGAGTNVSGTISENTTWNADHSPYIVNSGLTVSAGTVLTIEEGTVVRLSNSEERLIINGTLDVNGSSTLPVVFTSNTDQPGYHWGGITISSTGSANINFAEIRYAGDKDLFPYDAPAIIANSALSITNSIIRDCWGDGINLNVNSADDVTISDNSIYGCDFGIDIAQYVGGQMVFENNTVYDCSQQSVFINQSAFSPASLTGYNSNNFLGTQGFGSGPFQVDMTLQGETISFDNSDADVVVPQGIALTIEEGTTIKFRNSIEERFIINGTLDVNGSSGSPVVFTSSTDQPGYQWGGITISSTGSANIDFAEIRYAGNKDMFPYTSPAIIANGAVSVTNSVIRDCWGDGINLNIGNTADVTISDNSIYGCDIGIDIAQYAGGQMIFENNTVYDCSEITVFINQSSFVPTALTGYNSNNLLGLQGFGSGSFQVDMTLQGGEIYFDNSASDVVVPEGITLTISEGTTLSFRQNFEYRLIVEGTLNVNGSSGLPVVFTSLSDQPGIYWGGITVSSTGIATIDFAEIRYAGNKAGFPYTSPAIIANSALSITNSVIRDCFGDGINLNIGSSADVTISDNSIYGCDIGIDIAQYAGGQMIFENNTVYDCSEITVFINQSSFVPTALTGYNNNNLLGLQGFGSGSFQVDMTLQGGEIYFDNSVSDVVVPESITLTIPEGTTLSFRQNFEHRLIVEGTLNVNGSPGLPVVFTSVSDQPGIYWGGITVASTGIATIEYAKLRYAGDKDGFPYRSSAIIDNGDLNITNSKIYSCFGNGLEINSSLSPIIKYCSFDDFSGYDYAVYNVNSGSSTIDASYNYWGSKRGPAFYIRDPESGSWYFTTDGELVSPGVSYIPYYGYDLNSQMQFGRNNAPSGSFSTQFTDLSFSNSLETLAIVRTYNSLDSREATNFGRGWSMGFEGSITDYSIEIVGEGGETITQTCPDLKIVRLMNGAVFSFEQQADGSFVANDSHNTLTTENGKYVLFSTDQSIYRFDDNGHLISIEDKNGNVTTINIDGTGKITSIADCTGRSFTVNYSGDHISSIEETLTGRSVTYLYTNNQLSEVIDPNGSSTYFTYDSDGFVNGVYDNDNNVINLITYDHTEGDNQDKVLTKTDSYGNTSTYSYNLTSQVVTIVDDNARQTLQYYDDNLNIIRYVDAEGRETLTEYSLEDKYSEPLSTTDRNGNKTQYERDDRGNITKVINPDGSSRVMTYDTQNNLLSQKDENGKYTYFVYDSAGNQIEKAQPLNGTDVYVGNETGFAVTHYTYYLSADNKAMDGLLATVTDPEGNTTTYDYDSYGNLSSLTTATGNTFTYIYNSCGWLISETTPSTAEKPAGYTTSYEYDAIGRDIKTVLDGSKTHRQVYDDTGRLLQEVLPNQYDAGDDINGNYISNYGTRFTYYNNGEVQSVTDAEDNLTTYTYDSYSNVLTETRPNTARYRYTYDEMNRPTNMYYRESASDTEYLIENYSYSVLADNKTQKTVRIYIDEFDYNTEIYTYDYAEREISKQHADGTVTSTTYNANGTVEKTQDTAGNYTHYSYDELNRTTAVWAPFEDGLYAYTGYSYDKAGRIIQESAGIDPAALDEVPANLVAISKTYNADGSLHTTIDSEGRKTVYEYDTIGQVTRTEVFTDDVNSIVTDFALDYQGNLLSKSLHVRLGDIYSNDFSDNSSLLLTTVFTYDDNGNLVSRTAPDSTVATFTYDNLNRQTETSVAGVDEYGNPTTIKSHTTYTWDGNISTTTDANGNIAQYLYDGRGLLVEQIDALNHSARNYYDLEGHLIAVVSPKSYDPQAQLGEMDRTEYAYDSMGRVVTVTQHYFDDVLSQWVSFVEKAYQYDSNGNKIKELSASGYEDGTGVTASEKIESGYGTEYTYNDANLLIAELDAISKDQGLSQSVQYEYDTLGRLLSETNANEVITSYSYNHRGDLLTTSVQKTASDPAQVIETNTYDDLGRILSSTDGNGNITTYTYNALDQVSTVSFPGDGTLAATDQFFQYDVLGYLVSTWDSTGAKAQYVYDDLGRLLSETNSKTDGTDSITATYFYDKNGNLRFSTDGNGNVTTRTYDQLNQLAGMIINGQTTTYAYDANRNLLTTTDWLNNTITNEYDPLNRLINTIDPYQNMIESRQYDNNSQQTASTDANGHETAYEYDKNGRLTKTIDPENHETTMAYDNVGNVLNSTDANNQTTSYSYDEFNRLLTVTNAKSETTSYIYDLNGNMLTQTDGAGNVTTYEYNVRNLLIKLISHDGRSGSPGSYAYDWDKVVRYEYTPASLISGSSGLLSTQIDRNGNITSYTYDIHGRKLTETCNSQSVAYIYDNNGNVLTITDSTGTTSRTFDPYNRVLTKTVPDLGTSIFEYDITTGMDIGCWSETSEDNTGRLVQKVYDRNGRLQQVITGSDTTTYSYFNNGSISSVVYPDGTSETYTYYDDNQLHTLINKKADQTIIDSYSYIYDNANNIVIKTDSIGTTTYAYDELNRLTSEISPSSNTSFTYDSAGNRNTETVVESGDTHVTTYYYDSANKLIDTIATLNGALFQTTDYEHDNNGNMLTRTVTDYVDGIPQTPVVELSNTYDYFNQLIISVTSDNTTITNTYNGEGLRVEKDVNGSTTKFLYEASRVVSEYDEQNAQTAWNVYGLNLIVRQSGGSIYYFLYNGHADVTALVNATTGEVNGTYYYDAFGNILSQTGNIDNSILYSGYQYDIETGLYYCNARMYDPVIARFIQEDTYRGDPNDPLSLNLYSYCANNPIRYYDPSGHNFIDDFYDSYIWNGPVADWFDGMYNSPNKNIVRDFYEGPVGQALTDALFVVASSDTVRNIMYYNDHMDEAMGVINDNVFEPFVTDTLGIEKDSLGYDIIKNIGVRAEGLVLTAANATTGIVDSAAYAGVTVVDSANMKITSSKKNLNNMLTSIGVVEYDETKSRQLDIDQAKAESRYYSTMAGWGESAVGFFNNVSYSLDPENTINYLTNPDLTVSEAEQYTTAVSTTLITAVTIADFYHNLGSVKSNASQNTVQNKPVISEGGTGNVKTYQTYTKTNPITGEVYSGRTSGTGTPLENIATRDASHHMNQKGFGPAVLDSSSINAAAIRGREQMLIEANGGAKSIGGSSGNAINGIGPNNPKASYYFQEAIKEFLR